MSLSPSVRSSVRSHFFSFSVLGVLSSPKVSQGCFKKVLRMFEVSMKFQGCFKQVLRVFTKSLKSVSRKPQEWFKEVSGKFQGCFKKVSRVFQVRLKGVSRVFERRLIGVFGSFMGVSMPF